MIVNDQNEIVAQKIITAKMIYLSSDPWQSTD